MRALTQKLCAVGMRNAILRNYLSKQVERFLYSERFPVQIALVNSRPKKLQNESLQFTSLDRKAPVIGTKLLHSR